MYLLFRIQTKRCKVYPADHGLCDIPHLTIQIVIQEVRFSPVANDIIETFPSRIDQILVIVDYAILTSDDGVKRGLGVLQADRSSIQP